MMNLSNTNVPYNLMMTDFETVAHYTHVLCELATCSSKIMQYRNDDVIDVSILGVPCKMDARQLMQHIRIQMNFFERIVEEAQERIAKSEGKVG